MGCGLSGCVPVYRHLIGSGSCVGELRECWYPVVRVCRALTQVKRCKEIDAQRSAEGNRGRKREKDTFEDDEEEEVRKGFKDQSK